MGVHAYKKDAFGGDIFPAAPNLGDAFSAHSTGENFIEAFFTQESANDSSYDEFDALILDPYQKSLKARVFEIIESGRHGEALHVLITELESKSAAYQVETLSKFRDMFEDSGLKNLVNDIADLLSYYDMGWNNELYNTSQNSAGSAPQTDVKNNRYPIEMHIARNDHMPAPVFVPPFLGIGPT